MKRIAVLVSGGGTNLQALLDAKAHGRLDNVIFCAVISSNPSAYALERAKNADVPTFTVPVKDFPSRAQYDQALCDLLLSQNPDFIVLAGYLYVLPPELLSHFPQRIINVHPSLIPAFCGDGCYGLRVHQAALDKGVKVTGATVHFVNEIVDGGEILLQKAVPVLPGDDAPTLQRRVMEQAEWLILPQALAMLTQSPAPASPASVSPSDPKMSPKNEKKNTITHNPKGGSHPVEDLFVLLRQNPYPGRGIVTGLSDDGRHAVVAYFIMGRSENSRNRVFVLQGDTLEAKAFDESKVQDPSLILYTPIRRLDKYTIVTNGDQTDTICQGLQNGLSFQKALRKRTFEPDAPNFTPRISAILKHKKNRLSYKMAILKTQNGDPQSLLRQFFEYPQPLPGIGHFLHTYAGGGDPLPSFFGEPLCVSIPGDLSTFAQNLWDSLDYQNKISLYVEFTNLHTGDRQYRLLNKNQL